MGLGRAPQIDYAYWTRKALEHRGCPSTVEEIAGYINASNGVKVLSMNLRHYLLYRGGKNDFHCEKVQRWCTSVEGKRQYRWLWVASLWAWKFPLTPESQMGVKEEPTAKEEAPASVTIPSSEPTASVESNKRLQESRRRLERASNGHNPFTTPALPLPPAVPPDGSLMDLIYTRAMNKNVPDAEFRVFVKTLLVRT